MYLSHLFDVLCCNSAYSNKKTTKLQLRHPESEENIGLLGTKSCEINNSKRKLLISRLSYLQ